MRLIPATDTEVDTHVLVADADELDGERELHFQEWWTRYRAALPAIAFRQRNIERRRPAPGVVEAIVGADLVLVAPSNPVVSIGTIVSVPGIREAILETHAPVVGVSPIIGGKVVRGMADACLPAIGVDTTAEAVGRHYGARSARRPPRRLARRRDGCRRGRAARGGRPRRGIRAPVDARPRHVRRAGRRGHRPRSAHHREPAIRQPGDLRRLLT